MDRQEQTASAVNHPVHYNAHPSGVETIEIVECMNFCLGNAVKYITRCDLKGSPVEDLAKALWYVRRDLAARREARMIMLPRIEHGYYPGSEAVARFLQAEPSGFVRTAVEALWAAHKSPSVCVDLHTVVDVLEREIARRKREEG